MLVVRHILEETFIVVLSALSWKRVNNVVVDKLLQKTKHDTPQKIILSMHML